MAEVKGAVETQHALCRQCQDESSRRLVALEGDVWGNGKEGLRQVLTAHGQRIGTTESGLASLRTHGWDRRVVAGTVLLTSVCGGIGLGLTLVIKKVLGL